MSDILSDFSFIPFKLIKLKEEIVDSDEIFDGEIKLSETNLERIRELILEIQELNENQYKYFAIQLDKLDIRLMIEYMESNDMNVNLRKLYEIIKIKNYPGTISRIYRLYQNNYKNEEFKLFLLDYIDYIESPYEELDMDENMFRILTYWLKKSENIIKSISEQYLRISEKIGIDRYLSMFNFDPGLAIYRDAFKNILFIGDEKIYFKTSDILIIEVFKVMDYKEVLKFMNRYLTVVSLDDFNNDLLKYIQMRYDNPENLDNKEFWNQLDDYAVDKYMDWYNREKIREFFDGDERYTFWYKYVQEGYAKILSGNREQLFLEFDTFYAIEFKEIGNAAYLYPKEIFERRYKNRAKSRIISDNSRYKDMNIKHERILHSGNWQENNAPKISRLLRTW